MSDLGRDNYPDTLTVHVEDGEVRVCGATTVLVLHTEMARQLAVRLLDAVIEAREPGR